MQRYFHNQIQIQKKYKEKDGTLINGKSEHDWPSAPDKPEENSVRETDSSATWQDEQKQVTPYASNVWHVLKNMQNSG